MKKFLFVIYSASLVFIFSSCVKPKDELLKPVDNSSQTTLSTIQVSENFNWSTTKPLNINFTGSSEGDYQLVLKVISPEGTVLFQKLQKANENYEGVIEIPAHFESLTVSFGNLNKTFDCKSGSINVTID